MGGSVIQKDLCGINAESGDDHSPREKHIDRWSSHLGSQLKSGMDDVGQTVGMSQILVGLLHLPVLDQFPDIGGTDHDPVLGHSRDHITADPQFVAVFTESLCISLSAVTEGEVVTYHDPAYIQFTDDTVHELFPRHVHDFFIEMDKHDIIDAEQTADDVFSSRIVVEKRDFMSVDKSIRMNVKR